MAFLLPNIVPFLHAESVNVGFLRRPFQRAVTRCILFESSEIKPSKALGNNAERQKAQSKQNVQTAIVMYEMNVYLISQHISRQ